MEGTSGALNIQVPAGEAINSEEEAQNPRKIIIIIASQDFPWSMKEWQNPSSLGPLGLLISTSCLKGLGGA